MKRRGELIVPAMHATHEAADIDAILDPLLDEMRARAWDAGYETGWDSRREWAATDQFRDDPNPYRKASTYDAADPKHPQHGNPNSYYRAWTVDEPLRTLHTIEYKALAVPVEGRADVDRARPIGQPLRTQNTRLETALVMDNNHSNPGYRPWYRTRRDDNPTVCDVCWLTKPCGCEDER